MEKIVRECSHPGPTEFVQALLNGVTEKTQQRRHQVAQNPDAVHTIEATHPSKLPGKLGHASIVAFKVGRITTTYPARGSLPKDKK